MRMKKFLVFLITTLAITACKQDEKKQFQSDFLKQGYIIFEEINGDLNNDGIKDLVLITKGTDKSKIITDKYRGELDRNRRGIIILLNKNNRYILAEENYNCFSSENEEGGVYFPPMLKVDIEKNNLYLNYFHGRYGSYKYTFQYKNSDFELIAFKNIEESSNPLSRKVINDNFLTKKRLIKRNINESANLGDEVYEESWEDINIDRLIKLSEIKDFDELFPILAYSSPITLSDYLKKL
jgi:hypothetical protein